MAPLIILAGPTASGKSEIALDLARDLGSEIISADSMQVYKYFDIGTAKPSLDERDQVVHHMIDIIEPEQTFSAYEFKERALEHISTLTQAGKVPILVGGTGLYLKVLMEDFGCGVPVDETIKNRLQKRLEEDGLPVLYERLRELDPVYAAKIQAGDPQRILRALSVCEATGKAFSDFHQPAESPLADYQTHFFILEWDRKTLYSKIESRIDRMIESGWVDEVKGLLSKGYSKTLKPFQSIGYRQIAEYLEGQSTLDEAINEIKKESRHYAKRQFTWFKKMPQGTSLPLSGKKDLAGVKGKILSGLSGALCSVAFALFFALQFAAPTWASAPALEEAFKNIAVKEFDKAENHLKAVRKTSPDSPESKRALFLLGQVYLDNNRAEQSVKVLKQALKEYNVLEDYVRFTLAKAYIDLNQYDAALEQIHKIQKNFANSRVFPQASLLEIKVSLGQGKPEQAVASIDRLIRSLSNKQLKKEYRRELPKLLLKKYQQLKKINKPNQAYKGFRKLYLRYPADSIINEVLEELKQFKKKEFPPALSTRETIKRTRTLLRNARFKEVVDEVERFKKKKGENLPGSLYFYLERAQKSLIGRKASVETLQDFIKKFPHHSRVQEANYAIAKHLWNLNRDSEAVEYFKKVLQMKPESHWALDSHFMLGRLFEGNKKFKKASKHYGQLARASGSSEYKEKAAWRLGWIPYQQGRFEEAAKGFQENLKRFPKGDLEEQNRFWLAKSYLQLDRQSEGVKALAELNQKFPYSYYGLRAGELLANGKYRVPATDPKSPKIQKTNYLSKEAEPVEPPRALSPKDRFHLNRAQEMVSLRMFKDAAFEIRFVERHTKKNLSGVLWLADLYNASQAYSETVRLLYMYKNFISKSKEKDLSLQFWRSLYSLSYSSSIQRHADKNKVDPYFVRGLIQQESLFDTHALSPAGARGLMQIMPKTGQRLVNTYTKTDHFVEDSLYDPELNIQLGIKYLSELINEFGDNKPYLLISYNAGPHTLRRWQRRFRNLKDEDVFVESIPYPETRKYIKKVMRNYGIFRTIYPLPHSSKTETPNEPTKDIKS